MSFLDAAFLFAFLPLTLVAFWAARGIAGSNASLALLTAASVLFCIPFGWGFTALVLTSALVNFVLCRAMASAPKSRTLWLVLGLAFNLGALAIFKYGPVFDWIPGARSITRTVAAFVPITISFFTFQRLVLLLDCHQGDSSALALAGAGPGASGAKRGGGLAFGAFVLAFPNLVIGPIAYASEVGPQLLSQAFGRFRRLDVEVGLVLLTTGLFKKVMIADPLGARVVNIVFERVHTGAPVLGPEVAIAMVGYSAQLYFDFSGYSDMALGIARMFGLRLPINFNSPLRATGIMDFYRRWHIALTRVIVRFLFQPLSISFTRFAAERGLRGLQARAISVWTALLINFVVIGIWHGAAWTYVCFGVMHGTWFIIETEMRRAKWWKRYHQTTSASLQRLLGQAVTFVPLVFSFAMFRSHDLHDFAALFGYLGSGWVQFLDRGQLHLLTPRGYGLLVAAFAIIWLLPNVYELLRLYRPGVMTFPVPSLTPRWTRFLWRPTLIWGALTAVAGLCVLFAIGAPAPFVYGGF